MGFLKIHPIQGKELTIKTKCGMYSFVGSDNVV